MNAHDALKLFEVLVHGFELIEKLSPDLPVTARSIVKAIKEGTSGKTSPEIVLAELRSLRDLISHNDAEIDERVHKKFDVTDEEKTKP